MPYNADKQEKEILKYWDEHDCFNKSVDQRPEDKLYVFYDGPPFATGLPHYGHILSSVIKDVVPRYWTMKGYKVRRRWGWDCHGLPIESMIEKELKTSGKKDIEEKIGVQGFNKACCSKVLLYTKEWKKMIDRIGRWIEFDNAYKTMDSTYMESIWWALKTIWEKGLIYEGRKVLMYCPRCETPISKAEVAMDNSYKDITEEAVTVKFKVKDPAKHSLPENTFILAWTTTPWTLPGNVALAVGNDIEYVLAKVGRLSTFNNKASKETIKYLRDENTKQINNPQLYILAKDRIKEIFKDVRYKIVKNMPGKDLVGIEYEPLYEIQGVKDSGKKAWYVADADFVTTEEGTGIVHTAVIYGEDDYNLGLKIDLPMVPTLNECGIFNEQSPELIRDKYFKKAEKDIKSDLQERGLLFKRDNYTHSYPHCWRCDTQLFYNAISAWFINIQKIKDRLIELNEKVNWFPEHLKHGRFLNILETAPDWNISRNRYWATPLPFWKCDNEICDKKECLGSVKELKDMAINFSEVYGTDEVSEMDLHKHKMDQIKLKCSKCSSEMSRIPEVIDCWVESGSMPFAEFHYPFENEDTFKKRFPGQYIAEYIAQTRAWFYYMHVMAVLLFDDISFENCITTGTILNAKGEKLSKSKMNYTDPWVIIEQYGVDALRYYLMTGVVMQAENLFFNDREVKDIYNKVINILWNVLEFYKMYANGDGQNAFAVAGVGADKNAEPSNILDKWILMKLQLLVKEVTEQMDNYNTVKAGRPIRDFIDELSTWYVRRSRDRFKVGDEGDKQSAVATLREVLLTLSKVMAPFTPFIAEKIYQDVGGEKESVHLEEWPLIKEESMDDNVISDMMLVRKMVEMGLSLRSEAGIKVRQPLGKLIINNEQLTKEFLDIIADELNVKNIEIVEKIQVVGDAILKEEGNLQVSLDIEITPKLKKQGLVREIIRSVNQIRKDKKLSIDKKAIVEYETDDELLGGTFVEYTEELMKNTATSEFKQGHGDTEVKIDGRDIKLKVVGVE
ncbi:MAG: isoleucine--tRNA ligase [bacterium]